jgi:hypothetical protein
MKRKSFMDKRKKVNFLFSLTAVFFMVFPGVLFAQMSLLTRQYTY